MKLSEKAKKRIFIAGLSVVCVILVIAISSQFKKDDTSNAIIPVTPKVTDAAEPDAEIITSAVETVNDQEITVQPIEPTAIPTPTKGADTEDSKETEQSIQTEPVKPKAPTETPAVSDAKAVTNPNKEPEYKPEDKVKTKPSEPKSGDKKDGKIYVPGFGWIEDNGDGVEQNDVSSDGDIEKQVGDMD